MCCARTCSIRCFFFSFLSRGECQGSVTWEVRDCLKWRGLKVGQQIVLQFAVHLRFEAERERNRRTRKLRRSCWTTPRVSFHSLRVCFLVEQAPRILLVFTLDHCTPCNMQRRPKSGRRQRRGHASRVASIQVNFFCSEASKAKWLWSGLISIRDGKCATFMVINEVGKGIIGNYVTVVDF